jgi:hypothetical protein
MNFPAQVVVSADGPCDPITYPLAHAGPVDNQWTDAHANAPYYSYGGGKWKNPGYGCGAKAYVNNQGTQGVPLGLIPGSDLQFGSINGGPTTTKWTMPCTKIPSTAPVKGLECLGNDQNGIPVYGVPSPTVQVPVACLFNYLPPNNYEDPNAGKNELYPTTGIDGKTQYDPAADNTNPGLEGNALFCTFQAQTMANGVWKNIGSPVSLNTMIPNCQTSPPAPNPCSSPGYLWSNTNLVVPLSSVEQPVRISYDFFVGQLGSQDSSGLTDTPIGGALCSGATQNLPSNANMRLACDVTQGRPTFGDAVGATPPVNLAVEPTGVAQLKVMPYRILYQPPGDQSTAKWTQSQSTDRSVTMSMANSVLNSQASSTSLALGGSASFGVGSFFSANISYTHTWEKDLQSTQTSASTKSNTVDFFQQSS